MKRPIIAIVLMTALVPTIGHAALINFAHSLPGVAGVVVLVSSMTEEPVPGIQRSWALSRHFIRNDTIYIRMHTDDNAPQNPEEHPDFWNYWAKAVHHNFYITERSECYLVASEPYGVPLAKALNATFVPFDMDREFMSVKGADVRQSLVESWANVLPEFKRCVNVTVTLFGQESVGKTAISKEVEKVGYGRFFTRTGEWARQYLETVGNELTLEKMEIILRGQLALQKTAKNAAVTALTIQDTDLFSTLGYYRLLGYTPSLDLANLAREQKSDMYFVMNDNVPFVPDPLRYGIHKRETTTEFWTDLLTEYSLPFTLVEAPAFVDGVLSQACVQEIASASLSVWSKKYGPIERYKRR